MDEHSLSQFDELMSTPHCEKDCLIGNIFLFKSPHLLQIVNESLREKDTGGVDKTSFSPELSQPVVSGAKVGLEDVVNEVFDNG